MSGRCSVDVVRVLLSMWGAAARREVFEECRGYPCKAGHEDVGPSGDGGLSDSDVEVVGRALLVLRQFDADAHGVIVRLYRRRDTVPAIAAELACGARRVAYLRERGEWFVAGQIL
ncbi:MAG: hypothetical protein Q8M07_01105 [Prosthecobacter sp.]|nr:hypothetical protein [Prosthecobacter sp.]